MFWWSVALLVAVALLVGVVVVRRLPGRCGPQRPCAFTKVAVVFNPSKFDDPAHAERQIRSRLVAGGVRELSWQYTTVDSPGTEQTRSAVDSGAQLVIAVGGDGTVMACVAALAETDVPLAVLPSGTGNLLAMNLGIPYGLDAAVRVALAGNTRLLDVGDAEGIKFTIMAGMGFDAAMMRDAPPQLKARAGKVAYAVSGVRHLRGRSHRFELVLDAGLRSERVVSIRGRAVLVGNLGSISRGIPLLPGAQPDDGLLAVAVLAPSGLFGWMRLAVRVLTRRGDSGTVLKHWAARTVTVSVAKPLDWQADGDAFAPVRSLSFAVVPQALRLCVPERRVD